MSHLDEGTLHALLDGELETTEVAEIQAHLGSCSACGLRLREVKEFLAEADRLIASVELGTQPVGAGPSPAQREAAARPEPVARREPPAQREPLVRPRPTADAPPREPWNEPPPRLLIPDNESAADRRSRRFRRMGWAALIAGVVGAGFLGVQFRPQPVRSTTLARATPAESDAVVSAAEASRPDSVTQSPESSTLALNDRAARTAKSKPAQAAPPAPAPAAAAPPARKDTAPSERPRELAARQEAARQSVAEPAGEEASPDSQTIDSTAEATTDGGEADSAAAGDIAAVRARADEALAELDRERRRNQAAAATAALDSGRRRRAAMAVAPAAAPTPPAPPTIEQRAQVYLRIGLDEASRQLGGPVHVIEGLSPMFMGLARGAVVTGADATRPVVRVVYQDSQGRLILLDQQRLRSGQPAPSAGPLSWLIGDTAMWLNGEASGDLLRTYRPRVR
jgi:cytoskeletal protein RodZ